jgi:undecaprenyl diphosphate synthase
MPTRTSLGGPLPGIHVGIILDGNGRWAAGRGLPRFAGHRAGARAVREVVEAAPDLGIGTLTLYAFSADNWRRPRDEVRRLIALLHAYLTAEVARCLANGVRVTVIGRRDRLPGAVVAAIEAIEAATAQGRRLHLRLAVDYSGRDAILAAAQRAAGAAMGPEAFAQLVTDDGAPVEVDLVIRTGGEQRLSDFLLWECAYAELRFVETPWPEFRVADLERAVASFHGAERRFGGLPGGAA